MSNQQPNPKWRLNLNRRDFLKAVIASGLALATRGVYKLFNPAKQKIVTANQGTGPYYYGTDSANATVTKNVEIPQLPQNFYIGRTGVGEAIYDETDPNFNQNAAIAAGVLFTHTYWVLKGPHYYWRLGRDYRQYGWDQGVAATRAWFSHPKSESFIGETIFGDIEGAMNDTDHQNRDRDDGWTDHYYYGSYQNPGYINVAKNRQVLEGFLDAIWNYYPYTFKAGIYTTSIIWRDWFGSGYYPPYNFVTWLAGGDYSCPPCAPCNPACDTKSQVDSRFVSVRNFSLGKMKTVI